MQVVTDLSVVARLDLVLFAWSALEDGIDVLPCPVCSDDV